MLIEDGPGLARLVDELADFDEIAVDTEADSFYSYQEKVCLIQITGGGVDYLVDPLADLDLSPLGDVLADPELRSAIATLSAHYPGTVASPTALEALTKYKIPL